MELRHQLQLPKQIAVFYLGKPPANMVFVL